MTADLSSQFRRAREELQRHGLLLVSDPKLPSVASLVTGEPVRGSWWGHPQGHTIFQVNQYLAEHPDVLVTKLVSEKTTFVDRALWQAVVTLGLACEPWQLRGLSSAARWLLDQVAAEGELRTDQVRLPRTVKTGSPAEGARELENKLLVYSEQIHTNSGAHAKRLESWQRWAGRVGLAPEKLTRAKEQLEQVLARLNEQFAARGRLPWNATAKRS